MAVNPEIEAGAIGEKRYAAAARICSFYLSNGSNLSDTRLQLLAWNKKNEPPLDGDEVDYILGDAITAKEKGEVAEVHGLSFPRDSIKGLAADFADTYSKYLESPWSFFCFGFLTCLGNLLADKVTLASEIAPQPRFYVVFIGESADDRKSEAIKRTVQFFENALICGDFRVCHGIGSAEGLGKVLGDGPEGDPKKLLLVFDELKSFVSKATIEGSTLLPAVNTLFEGVRFHSATKTHTIKLDDVYLSMMGASTLDTFSRMWTSTFLDIGFLNRLWLVCGRGERRFSIPQEIPETEKIYLQKKFGALLAGLPAGRRKLAVTEEAHSIFNDWYMNGEGSPFAKRLDTYGHRLMILMSVNEGQDVINGDIAARVVKLLEWQLEVRRECSPIDAEGQISRMEQMIRRALRPGPLGGRDLRWKVHYDRAGIFVFNAALNNLERSREVFHDRKQNVFCLQE